MRLFSEEDEDSFKAIDQTDYSKELLGLSKPEVVELVAFMLDEMAVDWKDDITKKTFSEHVS